MSQPLNSSPFYKAHLLGSIDYVWKGEQRTVRGLSIEPLHKGVTKAVSGDEVLYKILSGIDILRVGRVKEKKTALEHIKMLILGK